MSETIYNIIANQEQSRSQSGLFGAAQADDSAAPNFGGTATQAQLQEQYNNDPHLQQTFGGFDNYLAYMGEANDMLGNQSWWTSEGIDQRAPSQILREGEDLSRGSGQVTDVNDLRQSNYNARQSGYQQWLMSEENQALMNQYGIAPTIVDDKGDTYTWTGNGYMRTDINEDSRLGINDVAKAAIIGTIGAGLGGAAGTALGGSLGLGAAGTGAVKGAATGLLTGALSGDVTAEGVISGALTGGLTGGLQDWTGIVPGSAVEGLITGGGGTLINQAIDGEIDLKQAAINGLISGGINVVGDYFSDARQSALPQYEGTIYENSSDLAGLVGPGGLFDSVNPVGTGWLNDNILDPVLGAAKFVIVDPQGNKFFADKNGVIDFGDGTSTTVKAFKSNPGGYFNEWTSGVGYNNGLLSLSNDGYGEEWAELTQLERRQEEFGTWTETDQEALDWLNAQADDGTWSSWSEEQMAQYESLRSRSVNALRPNDHERLLELYQSNYEFINTANQGLDERYSFTNAPRDPNSQIFGILQLPLEDGGTPETTPPPTKANEGSTSDNPSQSESSSSSDSTSSEGAENSSEGDQDASGGEDQALSQGDERYAGDLNALPSGSSGLFGGDVTAQQIYELILRETDPEQRAKYERELENYLASSEEGSTIAGSNSGSDQELGTGSGNSYGEWTLPAAGGGSGVAEWMLPAGAGAAAGLLSGNVGSGNKVSEDPEWGPLFKYMKIDKWQRAREKLYSDMTKGMGMLA